MSNRFKRYVDVPAGSRVEVEVTPCDGKVATKAKLIQEQDVATWDPCLDPDPVVRVERGKRYFVSVRLAFLQASTVTLVIRVRTPTGGTHSSPWTWTVQGQQGDIELRGGLTERVV